MGDNVAILFYDLVVNPKTLYVSIAGKQIHVEEQKETYQELTFSLDGVDYLLEVMPFENKVMGVSRQRVENDEILFEQMATLRIPSRHPIMEFLYVDKVSLAEEPLNTFEQKLEISEETIKSRLKAIEGTNPWVIMSLPQLRRYGLEI